MEQPNLKYIKDLSNGEATFENKILKIICNEFPQEVNEYYSNLELKKFTAAADNVHKIKHKISILGLESGYTTAIEHEKNLLQNSIELNEKFDAVLSNISNYLETIKTNL